MHDPEATEAYIGNTTGKFRDDCRDLGNLSTQGYHAPSEAEQDPSFADWDSFEEDLRMSESDRRPPSSVLTPPAQEVSQRKDEYPTWPRQQIFDRSCLWKIFQAIFPSTDTTAESPTTATRPLSNLFEENLETPPQSGQIIRDAAALWACLPREPRGLRCSEPNPHPRSRGALLAALKIAPVEVHARQSLPPAESDLEENSGEPPGSSTLIQTKLLAPTKCRDPPSFLYQISHQWLSQYTLRLQTSAHKKGFF